MWRERDCYGIGNRMTGVSFPRSRKYLIVLACLFVLTTGVSAAPQGVTMNIEDVTLTGDSVIETENGVTDVAGWKSYTAETTISGDSGEYQACLVIGPPTDKREIACKEIEVTSDEAKTIAFQQKQWPKNASGHQTVSIIVRENNSTAAVKESPWTAKIQTNIYTKNGDADDDGLSNQDELDIETKIDTKDTDRDGLTDGKEVNVINSNPKQADSDNDGLSDGIEWNEHESSPIKKDSDNDSLSDPAEINKFGTNPIKPDTDGDGLIDDMELKKYKTDPNKKDTDGDGLLDREELNIYKTDPGKKDSDGDGLNDDTEVKEETNPNKWDTDGDSLGDGAEINKYGTDPNNGDTDGDGVSDSTEINLGTDPNGNTMMVFGYSIENPRAIGIGIAVVCLVAIAVLGYRWHRKQRTATDQESAQAVGDSTQPELEPEQQETDETVVSEPLTDENRIRQLLDESEGRLRQSEIVAETGWSKSKVSRLLSRMEDDGQITKITVGRENLITRPGDEPKHAGSAFEDQKDL
jgi:hypothetical protein